MLDSPLGQTKGAQYDGKLQETLVASAGEELAKRTADHFRICNTLLANYRPVGGSQLEVPIFDIRPPNSQVDFLTGSCWESIAKRYHRIVIQGADHFTIVQKRYANTIIRLPELWKALQDPRRSISLSTLDLRC